MLVLFIDKHICVCMYIYILYIYIYIYIYNTYVVFSAGLSRRAEDLQQIPLDVFTEAYAPRARPMRTWELREAPLFLWYDYFSCPQLEDSRSSKS